MSNKKILVCVGTRPNFIKITRLKECFAKKGITDFKLLHTGQHFDKNMSQVFFDELNLDKPDYFLGAKGNTQIATISDIMLKFEKILIDWIPDWVLVPGDVNSTLACAIVANRYKIKVAHIESGLRSFDRDMPEEINRIITDSITDLFLVTEQSGIDNLINEGKPAKNISFTGNSMIDSLIKFTEKINKSKIREKLSLTENYALVTLHRPSNVDDLTQLNKIIELLNTISKKIRIVFPIHPRTIKNLENLENKANKNITFTGPMGYLDFLKIMKESSFVFTDSGGIQEETTFLQIPCLTLRENTERPITITSGSNELISLDNKLILKKVDDILNGNWKKGEIPKYWDGKASERIVEAVLNF